MSFQHCLGLCLVFIPLIGIMAGTLKWNDAVIFPLNILALVPLIPQINRSLEVFNLGRSRAFNELLKSTLGNSVELMVGANAILQKQPHISQCVVLGSVLNNLLLVLGASIFYSGYDQKRLRFDRTLTTVLSSLMMVVFILLALPTIMDMISSTKTTPADQILLMQRMISLILVFLLLTFLLFRLGTHAAMFASTPFSPRDQAHGGHGTPLSQASEAQIPRPYIGKALATLILTVASVATFVCSYYIVSSLGGFAAATGVNQSSIAVALIPLLGNSVRNYSIIVGSRSSNQVELGIRAIINAVLRVTMLVAPLLVLIGWAFDQPLTLRFDGFEAIILLLSVVIMNYLISDGRSNYFEGLMLIGTYVIITISFLVRPEAPPNVIFLGS